MLLTGDTPGVSKLLHLSGHMGKAPCRFCKIIGSQYKIAFKRKTGTTGEKLQYYYPFQTPTLFLDNFPPDRRLDYRSLPDFDLTELPFRHHEDFVVEINKDLTQAQQLAEIRDTGIKGCSPLAHLPTIALPASCPVDIMHLVFLGLVRDLCALLNGTYFKQNELNLHAGRITEMQWRELGVNMTNIECPTSWGRHPRNIERYIKLFKAEELSNFLIRWSLPLLFKRVNNGTFKAWQSLVLAISMAVAYEIRYNELELIERHLLIFLRWFYDTFYHREYDRLPSCKYTIHALAHLVDGIRNWGSASYFWQFSQVCFSK